MWPPCDPGFDVGHEHGPITKLYVNLRPKRQRRIKTEQEQADSLAATDREVKFAADVGDLLYNGETGYFNAQGANALDTVSIHKKIEELRQKHLGSLATDGARNEFARRALVRTTGYSQTIERHAGAERGKLFDATYKSYQTATETDAAGSYDDPPEIERLIGLNHDRQIEYLTNIVGTKDPKIIEQALQDGDRKVYARVLQEFMLRRQPGAAKAYFEQIKDEMGPEALKWQKVLDAETQHAEDEALATDAWRQVKSFATDSITGRFDPDKAREAFDSGFDPDTRTRTQAQVFEEIRAAEQAENAKDTQRLARLSREVRRSGHLDRNSPDYRELDDRGRDVADGMLVRDAREKRADRADARREQMEIDGISANDFQYTVPVEVQANMTDDEIEARYPHASAGMIATIAGKYRAAAKTAVAQGRAVSTDAFNKEVEQTAKSIQGTSKAGPNKARADQFRQLATAWQQAYVQNNPTKPLDRADFNRQMNEWLTQWSVPRSVSNPLARAYKYGFEVTEADRSMLVRREPQAFQSRPVINERVTSTPTVRGMFSGHAPSQPPAPAAKKKVTVRAGDVVDGELLGQEPGSQWKINPDGTASPVR